MPSKLKPNKIDRVALLVADPHPANSTTDTGTYPLDYGDHMVNLIVGCWLTKEGASSLGNIQPFGMHNFSLLYLFNQLCDYKIL